MTSLAAGSKNVERYGFEVAGETAQHFPRRPAAPTSRPEAAMAAPPTIPAIPALRGTV